MKYQIKRALVSVSDKQGLIELAETLKKYNIEIISSGGTAKHLRENDYEITPIESVTGNPEAFAGRMKTLSFQISSALLFRRDNNADKEQAEKLGIKPIDLVVCNLYPFEKVLQEKSDLSELIENIDIGGPTMIRAAAKNYKYVTVCTDPSEYTELIDELSTNHGHTGIEYRQKAAAKTYRLMTKYDALIADKLEQEFNTDELTELRYGENPHQKAWVRSNSTTTTLANVRPIQGKRLSYNNLLDSDAAWNALIDLNQLNPNMKSAVIVKHLNPCGQAMGTNLIDTLEAAWNGDPKSSFGSIVALNSEVTKQEAIFLTERFIEVIIAPKFSSDALTIFANKKNLRLLELSVDISRSGIVKRDILGGELLQERDDFLETEFTLVTESKCVSDVELLKFGVLTAKNLKSNAITLVRKENDKYELIGAGMGNPNRFVSIEQAVAKAKENGVTNFENIYLISDAFFPFPDSVELAHKYGINKIIQPGGSIKDKEVIARCNEQNQSMYFANTRHFLH